MWRLGFWVTLAFANDEDFGLGIALRKRAKSILTNELCMTPQFSFDARIVFVVV